MFEFRRTYLNNSSLIKPRRSAKEGPRDNTFVITAGRGQRVTNTSRECTPYFSIFVVRWIEGGGGVIRSEICRRHSRRGFIAARLVRKRKRSVPNLPTKTGCLCLVYGNCSPSAADDPTLDIRKYTYVPGVFFQNKF